MSSREAEMPVRVPVGYWTDPLCVWAFVAEPRLDHVRATHGHQVEITHHVLPVFGSIPQRFREGPWAAGGPQGRAATTRRIAEQHGHTDVSGEVWLRDPPASSWSPSLAVAAVADMEAHGEAPPYAAAAFITALRRRFFVDDVNVARRSAQIDVAQASGLDLGGVVRRLDDGTAMARLWEDHAERERLKLQGSPTWVFDGGRSLLYGNFDAAILTATVDALVRGADAGGSCC